MIPIFAVALVFQDIRVETGDGTTIEKTNIVVDGGRIVAIGGPVPAGATIIDGTGKWLTPGLIDSATQLGISEVDLEASTDERRLGGALAPAFSVAAGFNPDSAWLPIVREHGVTSAIVSPTGSVIAGQAISIDLNGKAAATCAMFGSVSMEAAEQTGGTRGGAWLLLRQAVADARFYAKNRAGYEKAEARPLMLSPLHLEALQPLLDGKIPFVVEANRASDITQVVEWGRSEKIRIVIEGGAEAWKVAPLLAAAKVPVVLRPSTQEPATFDTLGARDDVATMLTAAGVRVLLATFGDTRRLRQEAGFAVRDGLPWKEALRSITLSPAEVFSIPDVGVIATGKRANVVVWTGDPFELSTRADRVFIDGVEQSPDHRQRRLVERYLRKTR